MASMLPGKRGHVATQALKYRLPQPSGSRCAVDDGSWHGFTVEDVERAERTMLDSGMLPNSVYRRCVDLQALLTALTSAGVMAPMQMVIQTPRQEGLDRLTLDGRKSRDKYLPSPEAIRALADIFSGSHPLDRFEQLLACLPALMFATGLRTIEVLQLSTDALRKESGRYFVYYFKAKGRRVVEDKIALSVRQAELVAEAIRRVMNLTEEARWRAQQLVASLNEMPLPAWAMEREWLSAVDYEGLMGSAPSPHLLAKIDSTRGDDGRIRIKRDSLRGYLQDVREQLSLESIRGVTRRADGSWLPLDQALFICFRNEGHKTKGTNPLLVSLVGQGQLGAFLGGAGNGMKSIFERLGFKEKSGEFINLNSHQLRHYVTSKAAGAGISDAHLVRWQRRVHEGDLAAYKHLTSEERLDRLRGSLKEGRLNGTIATMYFGLAEDEREVFLADVLQAVHITHLGFCVHDFNASPCPSAMNCVKRCGSYLFDTADPKQREVLVTLKRRNVRALEDAEAAKIRSEGAAAEEWVRDLKQTIEGLDVILGAGPTTGSKVVAPFEGEPSRFQELE
jgi:hypothetical protein